MTIEPPSGPCIDPVALAPFAGETGTPDTLTLATKTGVECLTFAYSYNWDGRRPAATAALFTEAAEVSFYLNGATEPTHGTVGRGPLLAGME